MIDEEQKLFMDQLCIIIVAKAMILQPTSLHNFFQTLGIHYFNRTSNSEANMKRSKKNKLQNLYHISMLAITQGWVFLVVIWSWIWTMYRAWCLKALSSRRVLSREEGRFALKGLKGCLLVLKGLPDDMQCRFLFLHMQFLISYCFWFNLFSYAFTFNCEHRHNGFSVSGYCGSGNPAHYSCTRGPIL